MRTLISIVPMLLALLAGCASTTPFDQDIDVLATSPSSSEVNPAYQRLRDAGVDAFPALVRRLDDDTTCASDSFDRHYGAVLFSRESGNARAPGDTYRATVGTVCFEIIQQQIQNHGWPKGFRHYYAFTEETVAAWLARHRGASLRQLREAAKAESLARVDADLAASPDSSQSAFYQSARECIQSWSVPSR